MQPVGTPRVTSRTKKKTSRTVRIFWGRDPARSRQYKEKETRRTHWRASSEAFNQNIYMVLNREGVVCSFRGKGGHSQLFEVFHVRKQIPGHFGEKQVTNSPSRKMEAWAGMGRHRNTARGCKRATYQRRQGRYYRTKYRNKKKLSAVSKLYLCNTRRTY